MTIFKLYNYTLQYLELWEEFFVGTSLFNGIYFYILKYLNLATIQRNHNRDDLLMYQIL